MCLRSIPEASLVFTRARGQHLPGRVPAQTRSNSNTQRSSGYPLRKPQRTSRATQRGAASPSTAAQHTCPLWPPAPARTLGTSVPPPPTDRHLAGTPGRLPENLRHRASLQGADGRVASRSRNPPAPTVGAGLRPAQTGAREGVPGAQHPTAGGEPAVRAAQAADDTKSTYAI